MLDLLKLYNVGRNDAIPKPVRSKHLCLASSDRSDEAEPPLPLAPAEIEADDADDVPSDELELLILTIGPQLFGIPADAAHAVAGASRLVAVAGALPGMAGMPIAEDQAMTAIDGRALLGLPGFPVPAQAKSAGIGGCWDGTFALVVDAVDPYRLRCLRREIRVLPPALVTLWDGIAVGLVRAADDLIVVLDPARLARAASQPLVPALSAADAA
jgi:chemotaxis signal transduction protein